MKRILYLGILLFLYAFVVVFGGCNHYQNVSMQASETPPTPTQETTICSPEEAAKLFSFIILGETTIQEVFEIVPYPADDVLATNHMFIRYHLPDGIDALVYFDHQTSLVVEVLLELPNGSRVML